MKCCLFCYKSCGNHDNSRPTIETSEGRTDEFEIPLRFFRLLERQERRSRPGGEAGLCGSRQSDLEESLDGLLKRCDNRLISFCEGCLKLLDSLWETYQRIECLELEMDRKLRQVTEVMTLANRMPSRVKRFRSFAVIEGDVWAEAPVRRFREVLVKKCTKLGDLGARVSLKRMRTSEPISGTKRSKIKEEVLDSSEHSLALEESIKLPPCDNCVKEDIEDSFHLNYTDVDDDNLSIPDICSERRDELIAEDVTASSLEGSVYEDIQEIKEDKKDAAIGTVKTSRGRRRRTCKIKLESPVSSSKEGIEDDYTATNFESLNAPVDLNKILKTEGETSPKLSRKADGANTKKQRLTTLPELDFSFKCSVTGCLEEFLRQEELENHSQMHAKFYCDFCPVSKDYAPDLALHEREHVPAGIVRFADPRKHRRRLGKFHCPRCEFTTCKIPTYIQHHLSTHLSLNPVTTTCPLCDKAFFNSGKCVRKTLQSHFDRMHNLKSSTKKKEASLQSWDCDECTAHFKKESQLVIHKRKLHGVKKRFKCEDCDKEFLHIITLTKHRKSIHQANLAFACSVEGCPRRFETDVRLQRHESRCRDAATREECRLKSCPVCGKLCEGGPLWMVNHLDICKGKRKNYKLGPVICEECGKECRNKATLAIHALSHSGPSSWQFTCDECGKKCKDIYKLKEHKRTHSKEKPFICSVCGKTYAHRAKWKNHMKTKHDIDLTDYRRVVFKYRTSTPT